MTKTLLKLPLAYRNGEIVDADESTVAGNMYDSYRHAVEDDAIGDFIVRAVNSHDALVAAAARVLKWVAPIAGDNRDDAASTEELQSVEELQKALALAEGRASLPTET